MSDDQNLIKEVNEEVRQDDYKRTWNKYKKIIIAAISLILIAVTSLNLLKYKKEKNIEQQSNLFFNAIELIEKEDYEKAKDIFKDINNSQKSGYSDLSFLFLIDLASKKKVSVNLDELKLKKKVYIMN